MYYTSSRIPTLLWHRAWKLGVAFGHEWTMAFGSLVGVGADSLYHARVSTEILTSIHLDWRDETGREDRGVCHPFTSTWIADDVVNGVWILGRWIHSATHRTGTGRCQWHIDDTGAVKIHINRPNGTYDGTTVLTVTVAVDGVVEWLTPGGDRCFGARHIDAVTAVLSALGVSTTVPPRLREAAEFFDNVLPTLAATLGTIDHWEDRAEIFDAHFTNRR